jgi:hypothetical protein
VEAGAVGRLTRAVAAAAVAVLSLATAAGPARAESTLWTLVASPLAATTGVETTFTLTATNMDPLANLLTSNEIGCVVVDVPANFAVAAAGVTGSNAGGSWAASLNGNQVRVQAGSGGDRLELLQWVRFTVRATPQAAGSLAWASRAYRDQGCGGGGALLGVPPVVVVTGLPVTPTPVPTLPPPPSTTPLPTRPPLPTLSPTPRSTATPVPTATPDGPRASDDARPSEPSSPQPTRSEAPADASTTPSGGGTARPPTGGGDGGTSGPAAPDAGGGRPPAVEPTLRIDTDLLLGVGSYGWVVSAAAVAVPGLLVIAWVAVQAGAAVIWIPAVRRLREERRRRHRLAVSLVGARTR